MLDQIDIAMPFDPRQVVYTGPETLAGRYLRSFWQPISASSAVAANHAKRIRIMGEDFTFYRNADELPHLVDSRCAHRGTQLSVGAVEGDSIRCYYHGWKYNATGQCVEQPGESEPFCEKIRIRSFPVRDYIGLVFAYFGDDDPPAFPLYENFERHQEGRIEVESAPFNYYQRMENSHDFAHLPFVHKQCYDVVERTLENVVPLVISEECEWGMRTHRMDPDGMDLVAYYGMPNINYIAMGSATAKEWDAAGELLLMRVPIDDENHLQFLLSWTSVPRPDKVRSQSSELLSEQHAATVQKVLAGDMTVDDVIAENRPDIFSIQDDIAMIGQGTIWERQPEHLGRSDVGVILLRKLWARDLRALREGRPRTQWFRPSDMVPRVAALPRHIR